MDSLGLTDIKFMRKIGGGGESKAFQDPQNKLFGLGRSSPSQFVRLIEMMDNGKLVSKDASAEMINILKRQQYKDGIGRGMPDTIPVASKSGALDHLRTDVGIIYTRRGRIAMAIILDDMKVVEYDEKIPASRCSGSSRKFCRTASVSEGHRPRIRRNGLLRDGGDRGG